MPREISEARFLVEAAATSVGTFALMVGVAAAGGGESPVIVVGAMLVVALAVFVYALAGVFDRI